jgi:hypothetical protein
VSVVFVVCCVGSGLCDSLITSTEEPYCIIYRYIYIYICVCVCVCVCSITLKNDVA